MLPSAQSVQSTATKAEANSDIIWVAPGENGARESLFFGDHTLLTHSIADDTNVIDFDESDALESDWDIGDITA